MRIKEETWKKWQIPFRPNGNVDWRMPTKGSEFFSGGWQRQNYHGYKKTHGDKITWRENKPFKASLKFKCMFHGARENTHAVFINTELGSEYVMRFEDLELCLQKGVLIHGVILGEWVFCCTSNRVSVMPIDFISTVK